MAQLITNGIKVSVKTTYDGVFTRQDNLNHLFSYYITIENESKENVQLLERHWDIFDSLNTLEIVEGEGVIGQTPTLKPTETYTYKSHCSLLGDAGSMSGFFTMINTATLETFQVIIPTFQLTTTVVLN